MRALIILVCSTILAAMSLSAVACRNVESSAAEVKLPDKNNLERLAAIDTDADGFPDAVELRTASDRHNFRRWFTAIASAQYDAISPEWQNAQRDCAGLVRFAWREALRRHDRRWREHVPAVGEVAPDVAAYSLTRHPLGESLFRVADGVFRRDDIAAHRFDTFADARTLKTHNSIYVGRDRDAARAGDLLFFHQPWLPRYPYHVMIYLGDEEGESRSSENALVVYHTGASEENAGSVRRVRLSTLDRHPDPRWRPVESNRNFLGFYRLKILD